MQAEYSRTLVKDIIVLNQVKRAAWIWKYENFYITFVVY